MTSEQQIAANRPNRARLSGAPTAACLWTREKMGSFCRMGLSGRRRMLIEDGESPG
jgi:hypothetical protein